jgi:hypothetical protein
MIWRSSSWLVLPLVYTTLCIAACTCVQAQTEQNATPVYKTGQLSIPLLASCKPNARTIGVFLTVCKENDGDPQTWARHMQEYFDAYGLPVKIVLNHDPPKGKAVRALIYVGGQEFKGNLSGGNVGLNYFFTQHEKVFANLAVLYKAANPDLFGE